MKKPIDVVLIGAGNRGRDVYARYIQQHPEQFRLVAVADPIDTRRQSIAKQHNIAPQHQYSSWQELLNCPQYGQAAIIATQDQFHTEPALAALQAGYDVLLEKPMSHRQDDCLRLVQMSEQTGRLLQIAHVLRYTPVMQQVKSILDSRVLGDIVTVSHRENVSFWHMAHSYVRGNWRKSADSSPMILAKCSHDFDLLYWLLERPCEQISSVGSLRHFQQDHAPEGAPSRCTDGCPVAQECPYEATNIYIKLQPFVAELSNTDHPIYRTIGKLAASRPGQLTFDTVSRMAPLMQILQNHCNLPRSAVADKLDQASIYRALETGPYGRCVYHHDNDVVDHQIALMSFKDDISVTLTMHGHSHQEGRTMRIDGTRATLFVRMTLLESMVKIHHNRTRRVDQFKFTHGLSGGHGGGDSGLMQAFYQALTNNEQTPLTTASASLESHLLAFAAEKSRLSGDMIQMEQYRKDAWEALKSAPEIRPHSSPSVPIEVRASTDTSATPMPPIRLQPSGSSGD